MILGTITQHGLVLSSNLATLPAQHSANFEIGVQTDPAYSGFTAMVNISFPSSGIEYQTVTLGIQERKFEVPEMVFANDGTVFLSLGLTNGNEFIVTHPIAFTVVEAPGQVIPELPAQDIWQTQVMNFVNSYLDQNACTKFIPVIGSNGNWIINGVDTGKTSKGQKGDPGINGTNGRAGKNGISVTHRWIGTTLEVTSASGTSSAQLKGEPGEPAPIPQLGDQVTFEYDSMSNTLNIVPVR